MKRSILLFIFLLAIGAAQAQTLNKTVEERLQSFFSNYTTVNAHIATSRMESMKLDTDRKTLEIYTNEAFGTQPFTPENVESIYRSLKQLLPDPVNHYKLTLYADGLPIEDLVPNALRKKGIDKQRLWNRIDYQGAPWVTNLSRPYTASAGLEGRHLAIHSSHGRYYKNDKGEWTWQRPNIHCTTEDLFTQSFVVPFLIPMLEKAGAVVFTARERDWQPNEVIVDNDITPAGSLYLEQKNRKARWTTAPLRGFAARKSVYYDQENPFTDGSVRMAATAQKKKAKTFVEWVPQIPATGRYAVYVSYQTLPNSITDAHYTVFHKGGATEFSVNQQMGGGTWVYLGTFEFEKGNHDTGMVVLSNESKQKGVVTADAVRFGGGRGNIARGASSADATVSGLPRYLEGARYTAQWSGMPYEVYSSKGGVNDYADDINTRSLMSNYLSGGSVYNPAQKGLRVPIELMLSVHSDAGYRKDDSLVGSLGIYTTNFNDGQLAAGLSRYTSRDLCDLVLSGMRRDLNGTFGIDWAQRVMWNRNYSETRLPAVPSMILEMLSHQNFADMKLGHDPRFKFALARSVYKSILKYVATMHQEEYVVQPLPVTRFATELVENGSKVKLSWQPMNDPLEPTATPTAYIVYTRIGYGDFDNGEVVRGTSFTKEIEPELVYSFKVTALNKGGESFPSEILSAYHTRKNRGTVLIVNGFDRLSGPATIETTTLQGFNMHEDPGVPYQRTPEYSGEQRVVSRNKLGIEGENGLGYSSSELVGMLLAGNSYDYPFLHGKAIQAAGGHSFASCSAKALEGSTIHPAQYPIVDYLSGVEQHPYPAAVQQWMTSYCGRGGKLLVSGSFTNDLSAAAFTQQTLKCISGGNLPTGTSEEVRGNGQAFTLYRTPNEESYAVPSPAILQGVENAFAVYAYSAGNYGAATAYRGNAYRTFVLGFPLESIKEVEARARVMATALKFFE